MNVADNRGTSRSEQEPPIVGNGRVGQTRVAVVASARICIGHGFRAAVTVDPRHAGEVELSIRADENVLPHVVAGLQAGVVVVGLGRGRFSRLTELSVETTVSRLSEIVADHASRVCVRGLHGSNVSLRADHASRVDAAGQVERWHVELANASSGRVVAEQASTICARLAQASELTLEGSAAHTVLEATGASRLLASSSRFETGRAHVDLNALSSASFYARDVVTGQLRGLSKLRIAGGAQIAVDGKVARG
jgi:hypothetical protein